MKIINKIFGSFFAIIMMTAFIFAGAGVSVANAATVTCAPGTTTGSASGTDASSGVTCQHKVKLTIDELIELNLSGVESEITPNLGGTAESSAATAIVKTNVSAGYKMQIIGSTTVYGSGDGNSACSAVNLLCRTYTSTAGTGGVSGPVITSAAFTSDTGAYTGTAAWGYRANSADTDTGAALSTYSAGTTAYSVVGTSAADISGATKSSPTAAHYTKIAFGAHMPVEQTAGTYEGHVTLSAVPLTP